MQIELFGQQVGVRKLASLARNPKKFAGLLRQTDEDARFSMAEIIADVFNVQRLDTQALAVSQEIPMGMERMTPETASELIAGCLSDGGAGLIEAFNEEAERRDRVLREALSDEQYQQFVQTKQQSVWTELDIEDEDAGDTEDSDQSDREA
ncbi:hypothetical protein [Haladaptatus cibarius]|uniref:hypothetical protein n=1 Tax=Haladaptatus cibarius TaxID=453847 RepID=UPI000678BB01|nr:hypothetical protein [Haladaptatus cibarius]